LNKRILPKQIKPSQTLQYMGDSAQLELGAELRVLVWNIYKAKRSNWLSDFTTLTADRDLVLLQEAISNAPSDRHFEASERLEWVMAGSHQHPTSHVITGVKSGCSVKPKKCVAHRSNYSEPVVKTQKLLLETHYALNARTDTLMVLNMHAINFVGVQKYIDQLEQLSDALESHAGPVLLIMCSTGAWICVQLNLWRTSVHQTMRLFWQRLVLVNQNRVDCL